MRKLLKVDRNGMSLAEKVLFARYFPDEINDKQADMMLHALGADYRPYRTYKGNRIYHAYRNFYDAGGSNVAEWDDLVSKGYAEKQWTYHVTVKGIHALEYLVQSRIWGNYSGVMDCRRAVLIEMMKAAVDCSYGCWFPTSSKTLSLRTAIPRKLILETLGSLAEEGLVMKDHYGEMDEDGGIHCYHGWILTQHAKEKYAEKYEELERAEAERINISIWEDAIYAEK